MKRNPVRNGQAKSEPGPDQPRDIDAEYGLEPVFEPAHSKGAEALDRAAQLRRVQCPYCGECFDTLVDLSAGSSAYVEDCQVCCRPIEFTVDVDSAGALAALVARRDD